MLYYNVFRFSVFKVCSLFLDLTDDARRVKSIYVNKMQYTIELDWIRILNSNPLTSDWWIWTKIWIRLLQKQWIWIWIQKLKQNKWIQPCIYGSIQLLLVHNIIIIISSQVVVNNHH